MTHRYGLIAAALTGLTWAGAHAHAVTLRYQPAPGSTIAYALSVSSETRAVGPGGKLELSGARGRVLGVVTAERPGQPDEVSLLCRVTGGAMAVSAGGLMGRYTPPAAVQRVIASSRGETRDWQEVEGDLVPLDPPSRIMLEPADLCLFEGYGALPDRDLRPGDTWSGTYREEPAEPDPSPTRIDYRSTFLGVGRFRGRPCARISTRWEVVEEEPADPGGPPLEVTMGGDTVWGLDAERGILLYYVDVITSSASVSLPPQARTLAASVRSRVTLTAYATLPEP